MSFYVFDVDGVMEGREDIYIRESIEELEKYPEKIIRFENSDADVLILGGK